MEPYELEHFQSQFTQQLNIDNDFRPLLTPASIAASENTGSPHINNFNRYFAPFSVDVSHVEESLANQENETNEENQSLNADSASDGDRQGDEENQNLNAGFDNGGDRQDDALPSGNANVNVFDDLNFLDSIADQSSDLLNEIPPASPHTNFNEKRLKFLAELKNIGYDIDKCVNSPSTSKTLQDITDGHTPARVALLQSIAKSLAIVNTIDDRDEFKLCSDFLLNSLHLSFQSQNKNEIQKQINNFVSTLQNTHLLSNVNQLVGSAKTLSTHQQNVTPSQSHLPLQQPNQQIVTGGPTTSVPTNQNTTSLPPPPLPQQQPPNNQISAATNTSLPENILNSSHPMVKQNQVFVLNSNIDLSTFQSTSQSINVHQQLNQAVSTNYSQIPESESRTVNDISEPNDVLSTVVNATINNNSSSNSPSLSVSTNSLAIPTNDPYVFAEDEHISSSSSFFGAQTRTYKTKKHLSSKGKNQQKKSKKSCIKNVKLYVCNKNMNGRQCGRSYSHASSLNIHQHTHIPNLKPYRCTLCPFEHNKPTSLTSHFKNEHRNGNSLTEYDYPFKCKFDVLNICNEKFRYKKRLAAHCLDKHPNNHPFNII